MLVSNIFSSMFACFLFFSVCNSELVHESIRMNEEISNDPKILDLKQRREIVEKYSSSLERKKESWVDPYEMINFSVIDREEAIAKSVEIPILSSVLLDLDNDDEPLFSDIKGDVIGSKASKHEDSGINAGVESEKLFTKSRQQICVLDSIYISRWLKRLILKIEKESDQEPSSVTFPMDSSLLESLKELSTAKSLEIVQLDELVCKMISQAYIARIEDFDWAAVAVYITNAWWVVLFTIAVGIVAYGIRHCILHYPKWTIVGCILLLCVFWHWMHLYKQRQAYKHAELSSMKIPDECRKFEFGLMEHIHNYVKSYFSNNECARYYEALMVDPFWEVSLSVAAAETVTAMFFQPLSAASRIINSSLKQLFDGLSIVITIPLVIFLFLLIIMMCNYRIKLPFFMGALEPHVPAVGSRVQDVQSLKALALSRQEKTHKIRCSIQLKDDKTLSLKKESDISSETENQRLEKTVLHISRSTPVNATCSPSSSDVCSSGNLELDCESCKNFEPEVSFDEEEEEEDSENNSEDMNSDEERAVTPEVSPESHHCCSCYLHSEDIQYMHEDCRVCNRTEEYSVLEEQENKDAEETVEHAFGQYEKIDITKERNSVDFRDKQLYSVPERTSETVDMINTMNSF